MPTLLAYTIIVSKDISIYILNSSNYYTNYYTYLISS